MMRFFLVICVLSLMQMTFAVDVKYDILTNIPTPGYISSALNLVIKAPGTEITEYNGKHLAGKMDSDVILFDITDQKTDYLPRKLSSKYVNMEILHVMNSGVKSISRDDFKAMPKLKELALFNNQIEIIPNNCFDDLILMERLSLTKNFIKTLPLRVFHALPNLKAVYLSQNSLIAIPADLFERNLKLEYIGFQANKLNFIGSSILTKLKNLKNVNFKTNVCIDDSYPRSTLENVVKTIKTKCNVDQCAAGAKDIAKLQEINKRLVEQQRANDKVIIGIKANCPNNHIGSSSTGSLPIVTSRPDLPELPPPGSLSVPDISPSGSLSVPDLPPPGFLSIGNPSPVVTPPVSLSIESPSIETPSQTTDISDDLQQKYDELKKSYDELALSKDCIYKVNNDKSNIELIFRHES